jgi:hypothetical protein
MAWTGEGTEIVSPFTGYIAWWIEPTYASDGCASIGTASDVAQRVTSARYETGDVMKYYNSIDSRSVTTATPGLVDYSFHLEYDVQKDDVLLRQLMSDIVSCSLPSFGFEVGENIGCTNAGYVAMYGNVVKSVEISGSSGEPWHVSADFSTSTMVASDTVTSTKAAGVGSVVDGILLMFNAGGSFTDTTGNVAIAINNISVRIENSIEDVYTIGSTAKQGAIPRELKITGSADMTIEDGNVNHLNDVVTGAVAGTLELKLGGTGAPKITLTNVRFDSESRDAASGDVFRSCPFTAEDVAYGTV